MEQPVIIPCSGIELEGMLDKQPAGRAVVMTHPHPLYGGNMDNMVVMQVVKRFSQLGFTTLRFNFRGTGKSTGTHADGIGEQEDVRAAVGFLEKQGATSIVLAGYSFGSRINAAVVSAGIKIDDHIMVSPPAAFMSFDEIETLPRTGLILTGENDEIAPSGMIKDLIRKWDLETRFEILDGCDHFYSGCLKQLDQCLTDYLENNP